MNVDDLIYQPIKKEKTFIKKEDWVCDGNPKNCSYRSTCEYYGCMRESIEEMMKDFIDSGFNI